jgi:hypothetical protein
VKNSDVTEGHDYVWSKYEPRGGDPLAHVRAMHPALTGGRRPIMGRMIEFLEDYDEPRWGSTIPKGTLRVVPARELRGSWAEVAEAEATKASLRTEGDRLVEEILSSLEALGLSAQGERAHVFAAIGGPDLKVTVSFYGADRAQRFSDALSFAVSAHDGYAPRG